MFRSRSRGKPSDDDMTPSPQRPSGRTQSAIVAFAAVTSGAILLLSGALDNPPRVDIDPVTESSGAVQNPAPRPEDAVMVEYLTAMKTWTECLASRPDATADVTSSTCGTMPEQPDDPRLNAYLAEVLDWNKCAAPRLRHGGLEQAIISCGPQPVSPLGN